jgi:hypothetical protein
MRIRRDEKLQCSKVDGETRGNVAAFTRTLADGIVELWRRWQMKPKAQTTEHTAHSTQHIQADAKQTIPSSATPSVLHLALRTEGHLPES